MNRDDKAAAISELNEGIGHATNAFLISFKGITVPQVTELRKQVRESGSDYIVVKNTLALIAVKDSPLVALKEQFRGETARRFGLVVNDHHDQRLHPYHASRAAARYLHYLHRHYHGDWPLALAAYNAGEHRVDRALARLPNGTFWQLADRGYLPRTSKDYVPRFLAVVRVVEGKQVCRRSEVPTTLVNLDAPVVDPRRGAITQEARR